MKNETYFTEKATTVNGLQAYYNSQWYEITPIHIQPVYATGSVVHVFDHQSGRNLRWICSSAGPAATALFRLQA